MAKWWASTRRSTAAAAATWACRLPFPIDVANNVREQLVTNGKVTRGRIGVQIQEVDAKMADAFSLDRPRGALVGQVIDGGPAEKGGVKSR